MLAFNTRLNDSVKLFIYLFLFGRQRGRKEERQNLPSAGSLPKHLQQPEMGQVEARSLELNHAFLRGCHRPKYLSHHLLPSRVHINRKVELEAEPGLKPRHSDKG